MILELCDEALEFGLSAQHAIESAGGDDLVHFAEREPDAREQLIAPVLAGLGAWDLDPRAGVESLEAAAALCRSAGRWGLAYPVAERVCRLPGPTFDGLVVINERVPSARVGGLTLRWAAVNLAGEYFGATAKPMSSPPRRNAFVTELDLEPAGTCAEIDIAVALTLPCWTLLGMADRALDLTCAYVRDREQFGQPLASFQSVQFQLTDAEVERLGFEELAKYALWSIESRDSGMVIDALALRLAAIEAADTVFRIAHQLHGAIGFCDETTLSWISRYSAPLRRLPFGLSGTRSALAAGVDRRGLAGLFGGPADGAGERPGGVVAG